MWETAFTDTLVKLASHAQFSAEAKKLLAETGVSPNEVVVGGSGILGALGKKQIGDLDVWTSPSAYSKLSKHPKAVSGISASGGPKLTFQTPTGEIEMFTGSWYVGGKAYHGLNQSITMGGLPHWTPEKTLDWKQVMNRPKDQEDIRLLKEHVGKSI